MKSIKELLKFILIFALMIFSGMIIKLLLASFGIMYNPGDYYLYSIIDLLASLLVVIVLFIIHRKTLKEDLKKIIKEKNGIVKFLGYILLGYFILINLEGVCAIIQKLLSLVFSVQMTDSQNQEKVVEVIHSSPLIMAISACLLAPLEEELLFRGSIRKTIKNKGVFIAVSGLFFGLLHITDNYILLLILIALGFTLSEIISSKLKNKVWLSVISVVISLSLYIISIYIFHGSINT